MTLEITLADVMRYPAVTAHPLFQTYHSIDAGDGMVDYARNTFELSIIKGLGVQGNVTVPFVRKMDPTGAVIDARRVETFDPAKYDVVFLYDSGTSLMVGGRVHDYHAVNPRLSWAVLAEIPNWVVPRPDGQPLKGGGAAGAFVPEEGGGGEVVDYARIQAMVDEGKHWVKDQLTYYIREVTVPAVVEQVAARLSGDPGPIADLLYRRIADGTWEQLGKFGNEVGYKPPRGEGPNKADSPAVGSGPKE